MRSSTLAAISLAAVSTIVVAPPRPVLAQAGADSIVPLPIRTNMLSEQEAAAAQPHALPTLRRGQNGSLDRTPRGYGTAQHPFTTKGAYASGSSGYPSRLLPFRTTGRLVITYQDTSTSTCTASVIKKGIIVTAAHCVWAFGWANSGAASVRFEPARFGTGLPNTLPFGFWMGSDLVVPTVYQDGTDDCIDQGSATGCANDLALVVMNPNGSGKLPGEVVGTYAYTTVNGAFTSFLGQQAAQITQLGYPRKFDGGLKMIRTDSLGYLAAHNQIMIGSDMTQGSSGGPWLINFGINPVSENTTPSFNLPNRMVGITGWGHLADGYWQIKEMGGTRFATNSKYPSTPNIDSLLNTACTAYPSRC